MGSNEEARSFPNQSTYNIVFAILVSGIKSHFLVSKLHHSICLLVHKTGSKDQSADAIIFGRDAKQLATKATTFEKKRNLVFKLVWC